MKSLAYSIKQFFAPLILVKKYPRSLIQINLQTLAKPSDRWTTSFSTESPEQTKVNLVDEIQSVTEKAALINAASLALIDSGICMRGCGFAVGVAIIPSSAAALNQTQDSSNQADHVVLDPNPAEESSAKSLHLIGVHFGHLFNTPSSSGDNIGRVTLCESNGTFDYEQVRLLSFSSRSLDPLSSMYIYPLLVD
jgi:exosome complex component RRP46